MVLRLRIDHRRSPERPGEARRHPHGGHGAARPARAPAQGRGLEPLLCPAQGGRRRSLFGGANAVVACTVVIGMNKSAACVSVLFLTDCQHVFPRVCALSGKQNTQRNDVLRSATAYLMTYCVV
jgi:hypothetical protein